MVQLNAPSYFQQRPVHGNISVSLVNDVTMQAGQHLESHYSECSLYRQTSRSSSEKAEDRVLWG